MDQASKERGPNHTSSSLFGMNFPQAVVFFVCSQELDAVCLREVHTHPWTVTESGLCLCVCVCVCVCVLCEAGGSRNTFTLQVRGTKVHEGTRSLAYQGPRGPGPLVLQPGTRLFPVKTKLLSTLEMWVRQGLLVTPLRSHSHTVTFG